MSCHGCPGNIDPLIIVPQNALGPQGPQGIPGPPGPVGPAGLTWQGAWSNTGVYAINDAVGYSGASYFCINPVGPSVTNPASDTTNWALLAAQGAQGSQGVQGVQGNPGANGVSAYVYVGFASDTSGTNFNTIRNAGNVLRCYMNILTSTDPITSLTAGSFIVAGTVTYVTGWLNLCTDLGLISKSGNFSSGPSIPLTATIGDIFLNTGTASFYYYTGTQWIVLNNANPVTSIKNITPLGSFTNGSRNPQYRQIGSTIKMRGSINTTGTANLITTDVVLFNLNAGYRPGLTKYSTAFDPYTATWATIKIETNGDVVLLGTKTPVYVDELSLDTTQFELL